MLLLFGCTDDPFNPDNGNSSQLNAQIYLTENSQPKSNANIYIRYTCGDFIFPEACHDSFSRINQSIGYEIPYTGLVSIDAYDVDPFDVYSDSDGDGLSYM